MKLNSRDANIWFIADTHYSHKNIVSATSMWESREGCRDFDSIEEMNETIINNINKYVMADDILFHLGDWSFGGIDNILKFRERLYAKTIYLVRGNHDKHIYVNKQVASPSDNKIIGTKELFTSVHSYFELAIDKQFIIMSHFPICSWNEMHKDSWMLHGHCHGTLFGDESSGHWYNKSKILDVGIDNIFNMFGEYRPMNYNEIVKIMSKKYFISTDQHDEKTGR